MLTKLSDEQKKLIPVVRDEWLNHFFSLDFDEEKAKEFYRWIYKKCGFDEPLFLFFDDPLSCQFVVNLLDDSQIYPQIDSQIGSQIYSQICSQIYPQIDSQIGSQIDSQIYSQIDSQICSQICSQKLHYFNISHYGDISDYGWLAFYDYFEKIGIQHNCPDFTIFKQLIKQTNIFSAIQLRKICIICRPPVFIARDNQNRLHCIEKSAIVFRGGYEQYYVHGVYFDKKLFNKYFIDKTFTMSDILKLSNVEQKAAIIQIIGYEQILNELKPMILDKKQSLSFIDHKPVEYSLFECDCNGFRLRIIQVEDHTSHKKYIHGVPLIDETMSVDGALNWMFPCSNRKYNPDMES